VLLQVPRRSVYLCMGLPILTWNAGIRILVVGAVLVGGLTWFAIDATSMPGESYKKELPQMTGGQSDISRRLRTHVEELCSKGGRDYKNPLGLDGAIGLISKRFEEAGLEVSLEAFPAPLESGSEYTFFNIVAEIV
jgi:hypothetical protein